jgi:hypothetical protein
MEAIVRGVVLIAGAWMIISVPAALIIAGGIRFCDRRGRRRRVRAAARRLNRRTF